MFVGNFIWFISIAIMAIGTTGGVLEQSCSDSDATRLSSPTMDHPGYSPPGENRR